jgi:tripartite-type tricarboxylate transporter receptor subunit TctC
VTKLFLLIVLLMTAAQAWAQYPTKPIRLIVPAAPGGGTDIKAEPDGYTLLLVYVSHATNPTLVAKLPYDTLRDFAPITLVSHEPTLLVTPSVPANTLAEFIAYARERSGS